MKDYKLSVLILLIASIAIVALGFGAQKSCWAFFRHEALNNPQVFKEFWEDLADEVAKRKSE